MFRSTIAIAAVLTMTASGVFATTPAAVTAHPAAAHAAAAKPAAPAATTHVAAVRPARAAAPRAAAPARMASGAQQPRTAKSLACSRSADTRNLHGKQREAFMASCNRA